VHLLDALVPRLNWRRCALLLLGLLPGLVAVAQPYVIPTAVYDHAATESYPQEIQAGPSPAVTIATSDLVQFLSGTAVHLTAFHTQPGSHFEAHIVAGPPAAQMSNISAGGFTMSWSAVSGATYYSVDIATDPNFVTFVGGYQNRTTGAATFLVVSDLPTDTRAYYYRVRAYTPTAYVSTPAAGAVTLPAIIWQRIFTTSGTIEREEDWENDQLVGYSCSTDSYVLHLTWPGYIRVYTTGFTPLQGSVSGDTAYWQADGSSGDGLNFKIVRAGAAGDYHIYVTGADDDTTGDYQLCIDYLPFDTTPPTTPAEIHATGVTTTTISLAWSASTDDTGVTAYEVRIGDTVKATVNGFTTNAAVTGLSPNTTYVLGVRAQDGAGDGNWSGLATVTVTTAPDTTPPTTPTSLHGTAITATAISLAWAPATDDFGVAAYDVQLNGTIIGGSSAPAFQVTGLSPGVAYTFAVRARDAAGNTSSWSSTLGGTYYKLSLADDSQPAAYASAGSVLKIAASPPTGKYFSGWTMVSGAGTIGRANAPVTTFTMTTSDVVLQPVYHDGYKVVFPDYCIASTAGGQPGDTIIITDPTQPVFESPIAHTVWGLGWGVAEMKVPGVNPVTIKLVASDVSIVPNVWPRSNGLEPVQIQIGTTPDGSGIQGLAGVNESVRINSVAWSYNASIFLNAIQCSTDYGRTWDEHFEYTLVQPPYVGGISISNFSVLRSFPKPGTVILRSCAYDAGFMASTFAYTVLQIVEGTVTIPYGQITQQPANQIVSAGDSVTFTAAASGPPQYNTFTYQWAKGGAAIIGATQATLTLNAVQSTDEGYYSMNATDARHFSYSTNWAQLTVAPAAPPTIDSSPLGRTVTTGGSTTFTVTAHGVGTLTYQWRKDGGDISGATSSTLTLANVQSSDGGTYTAVVSSAGGPTVSAGALLTVAAAAPTITTPPASQTANAGSTVTFSVAAHGVDPLSYQWRKGGAAIVGATNATVTLTNISAADAGIYTVVVSNAGVSITSSGATLTVITAAPSITTQPVGQPVNLHGSATFTVAASGIPSPTYQWRKSGTSIIGATSASLAWSDAQMADAGSYDVVVTNDYGTVTSNPVTLSLTGGVPVITSAWAAAGTSGAAFTYQITATNSPTSYNATGLPANLGINTTSGYISGTPTTAGTFTVIITATNASGTSSGIGLTLTIGAGVQNDTSNQNQLNIHIPLGP
jgi:chitodextrinase